MERMEQAAPRRSPEEPGAFQAAAAAIAGELVARRSRARDGSVYWSGPGVRDGRVAATPLGPYLYSGTAGVALFLAALARTGEGLPGEAPGEGCRDLCLQALAPLRRELPGGAGKPLRGPAAPHPLRGPPGARAPGSPPAPRRPP